MSKLFELLQAAAANSDHPEEYKFAALTVYKNGEAVAAVNKKAIAEGNDEAELIAQLSQRLVESEKGEVAA